jgi:hypothetical protein
MWKIIKISIEYLSRPLLRLLRACLCREQEKCIRELIAGKKEALDAVLLEIKSNRKIAAKNSLIQGSSGLPGSLPFLELCSKNCQDYLLSGKLKLNDPLLEKAGQYADLIKQVHTLIENVKAATDKFQDGVANEHAVAIRKICSESLPGEKNDSERLPDIMNKLQALIEQEITRLPSAES